MLIKRNKFGVLELSSTSVKFLLGPNNSPKKFNPNDFTYIRVKTNTKEGLKGGLMNIIWFKDNVLPVILRFLPQTSIIVATAWARMCKNLDEILKLIPFPVKVLTVKEESKMALIGYLNSDHRDLSNYTDIVSIDMGGLSIELSTLCGKSISVNRQQQNRLLSYIPKGSLVVVNRNLFDNSGKPTLWNQHDQDYPDSLRNDLVEKIKNNGNTVVVNGMNLAFGVYYSR